MKQSKRKRSMTRASLIALGVAALSCGGEDPTSSVSSSPREQPLMQTRTVPVRVPVGTDQ